MNPPPDIRSTLDVASGSVGAVVVVAVVAALLAATRLLLSTAVIPPVSLALRRGRLSAVNASAPARRLPVFAHRPMGTQH